MAGVNSAQIQQATSGSSTPLSGGGAW